MGKKPIAIFRTKGNMLIARDMKKVLLAEEVTSNPEFISAKMNDLMAFKVIDGSDYTAIEVTAVQNNPQAFMEMAFGKAKSGET